MENASDVRKKALRTIDRVFKAEKDIRVAIAEELTKKGDGSGPTNKDPTGNHAMKMCKDIPFVRLRRGTKLWRPEAWILLINWNYAQSNDFERQVAELYYRQRKSVMSITTYYHKCTQSTAYTILREFRQHALEGACQLGLVEILQIEKF